MAHYGAQERVTIWTLLARERVLQLILAVLVGANFAVTASFEVALPVLSHARFGPSGYGAIMACFGAASIVGTLTAARAGGLSKPAVVSFVGVPHRRARRRLRPGGARAARRGRRDVRLRTGRGLRQRHLRDADPAVGSAGDDRPRDGRGHARLTGQLPIATAIAGMLARHLGPSPVFVISGTLLALAILAGLTQDKFRAFGAPIQQASGTGR